ncbi:MAG: hypothetical protein QOJ84_4308, partial [Bradyrhizobium sp.]|nr:hypothetical protein [Bradyrhizobium sp.]
WLAGKLLHHGPLPIAELRHWRAGAEPRWKFRSAEEIFPAFLGERSPPQRALYEDCLAGKDVLGSLNVTGALIETEFLFLRLLRESSEE